MFQTTNQVADFPLIKNPVETTDFHAEIRSFDGKSPHVCIGRHLTHVWKFDVTGLTEQMVSTEKNI